MSTSSEQTYHHGGLKEALAASTLALLAESGADALSLRAVARHAGVSAMAPYRHYKDKEHLLAEVAARGFVGLRDVLVAADAAAAPGQALIAQSVAYVAYALDNPALFRLMFGPVRLKTHAGLGTAGAAAYGVLAARVATDQPQEAMLEARVLGCWALVHGLALLFLDGRVETASVMPADALTQAVARAMMDR